jgi:hypothetical protein
VVIDKKKGTLKSQIKLFVAEILEDFAQTLSGKSKEKTMYLFYGNSSS